MSDDLTLPKTIELRMATRAGSIVGLTYMDDGFHATVPCNIPTCYLPARLMIYEIKDGGEVWRRCGTHCPDQYVEFLRQLTAVLGNMVGECL